MILIVTNKLDLTADFLILRLRRRGIDYIRFNTEDFPQKIKIVLTPGVNVLDQSYFVVYERKIYLSEISAVWYRHVMAPMPAPEITDPVARQFIEHESTHVLDAVWRILSCRWISHPDKIRQAGSKPHQLLIAAITGFAVPETIITNDVVAAKHFLDAHTKRVYKPMRFRQIDHSKDEKIGLIFTTLVTDEHLEQIHDIELSPTMFQSYIEKQTELRVTVVGDRVFAVEIDSQRHEVAKHDWRIADIRDLDHRSLSLPPDVEARCRQIVKHYGLSYGAIDLIRRPDDEYIFLELNSNGQWAWLEQILPDIGICDALIDLMIGVA